MAPEFLLASILAVAAQTGPDLSRSTLTFTPAAPLEGDIVRFALNARNTGGADLNYMEVRLDGPETAYVIAVRGLEDLVLEADDRRATGHIALLQGGESLIELDVLTPREAGGERLTVRARLASSEHSIEEWNTATASIEDRLPSGGITLGGIRLLPAALNVLGFLVGSFVLFLILTLLARRRTGSPLRVEPALATLAFMFTLGLWGHYGGMALRDYAILTSFVETNATVLGRRLHASASSSSSSTSSSSRSTDRSTYAPELALRYDVNGKAVHSTGYDSGSAMRFGGRAQRERELETFVPGAAITAWYDPKAPEDVVVRRGFGGAYLFALFSLPTLALGVWLVRRIA